MRAVDGSRRRKSFVGAFYRDCRVYGRLHYDEGARCFRGNCPRCGRYVQVKSGTSGVNVNFVEVTCR